MRASYICGVIALPTGATEDKPRSPKATKKPGKGKK